MLLQKTWESLQTCMEPAVTIEGTVSDLKRLGYADEPLRLHDMAFVEIRPTGERIQREIIALTLDLIDPTNSIVIIGKYIPNIVYINRDTNMKASGGGGGGGRGQTNLEKEFSEFETQIAANNYQILLRAWQQNINNEILRQAGISLDANGVITYADDNVNNWQAKLNVQADRIGLVVNGTGPNASIKAAEIVAAINQSGSSVTISADHILLNGDAVATSLYGKDVTIDDLIAGAVEMNSFTSNGNSTIDGQLNVLSIACDGAISCDSLTADAGIHAASLELGGHTASWETKTVCTGVSRTPLYMFPDSDGSNHYGSLVTGATFASITYLTY